MDTSKDKQIFLFIVLVSAGVAVLSLLANVGAI